jgi:integral membrane protein
MTTTSPIIRRFRLFCIAEGISWLILIVAMVVKRTMDKPGAIYWPGMFHGICFVGYLITAVPLFTTLKWSVRRVFGVVIAAIVPFGTFVLERKWLRGL